jgi:hypothetical protein
MRHRSTLRRMEVCREKVRPSTVRVLGECVETRRRADAVEVRDSKNPDGLVLRLSRGGFSHWLVVARNAEFDHLTGAGGLLARAGVLPGE